MISIGLSKQNRSKANLPAHSKRYVGVEFGVGAVKVAEVEFHGDTCRVIKQGASPYPISYWDDLPAHVDDFSQALKTAMSGAGISAKRVVVAIPRRLVTLKFTNLPKATEEQIEGLVQFEAQQYIPFPIEEVVISHQSFPSVKSDMTTVMIAAARTQTVIDFLRIFDKVNISVRRLSISSLALVDIPGQEEGHRSILQLEPGELGLTVIENGNAIFTRSAIYHDKSKDETDIGPISDELARTLAAFQNERRDVEIRELYVCGDHRFYSPLLSQLNDIFSISFQNLDGNLFPVANPDTLDYAVCIGLCVGEVLRKSHPINLIPPTHQDKRELQKKKMNRTAMMALGAIAVIALVWVVIQFISTENAQRKEALRWNMSLDQANKRIKELKEDNDILQKMITSLNSSAISRPDMVSIIKAVGDAVPNHQTLYLTRLSYGAGGIITLRGNANTPLDATKYAQSLENCGLFSEIHIGYLGDSQNSGMNAPLVNKTTPLAPLGKSGTPTGQDPTMNGPSGPTQTNFLITCQIRDIGSSTSRYVVDSKSVFVNHTLLTAKGKME
jgi:Tfp pilus assembly protein PilN